MDFALDIPPPGGVAPSLPDVIGLLSGPELIGAALLIVFLIVGCDTFNPHRGVRR